MRAAAFRALLGAVWALACMGQAGEPMPPAPQSPGPPGPSLVHPSKVGDVNEVDPSFFKVDYAWPPPVPVVMDCGNGVRDDCKMSEDLAPIPNPDEGHSTPIVGALVAFLFISSLCTGLFMCYQYYRKRVREEKHAPPPRTIRLVNGMGSRASSIKSPSFGSQQTSPDDGKIGGAEKTPSEIELELRADSPTSALDSIGVFTHSLTISIGRMEKDADEGGKTIAKRWMARIKNMSRPKKTQPALLSPLSPSSRQSSQSSPALSRQASPEKTKEEYVRENAKIKRHASMLTQQLDEQTRQLEQEKKENERMMSVVRLMKSEVMSSSRSGGKISPNDRGKDREFCEKEVEEKIERKMREHFQMELVRIHQIHQEESHGSHQQQNEASSEQHRSKGAALWSAISASQSIPYSTRVSAQAPPSGDQEAIPECSVSMIDHSNSAGPFPTLEEEYKETNPSENQQAINNDSDDVVSLDSSLSSALLHSGESMHSMHSGEDTSGKRLEHTGNSTDMNSGYELRVKPFNRAISYTNMVYDVGDSDED